MEEIAYHYWAFGLNLKSVIPFPELLPSDASVIVDVTITLGAVQRLNVPNDGYAGEHMQIDVSGFYLEIPGIVAYLVKDGNSIVVQPDEGGDWDSIRLFCLSNAFAALLQQRKLIPLHCSALLDGDELILIFGHSGAGKSTLFAALQDQGMKPFSDDVCVPHMDEKGLITMYSSYPMMKFWSNTLEWMGWQERVSRRVRPGFEKFAVYFHDVFEVSALKPRTIIILEKDETLAKPEIRALQGVELFRQLEVHAYRSEFLPYSDLKAAHFQLFTNLANQTSTYLLRRPAQGDSLNEMLDLINQI